MNLLSRVRLWRTRPHAKARLIIEETDQGWRFGVARRRWLRWPIKAWSPFYPGMDRAVVGLSHAYLKAAQTAGGAQLRRGERKRLAKKIVAGMVPRGR